jgi:hypothetical protein
LPNQPPFCHPSPHALKPTADITISLDDRSLPNSSSSSSISCLLFRSYVAPPPLPAGRVVK